MAASTFEKFLYPPPPSLLVKAMSVIAFTALIVVGFMEIKGKHLQYSKFMKVGSQKSEKKLKISSKFGMFVLYSPSVVVGLASFGLVTNGAFRFYLLCTALSIHFLKRVLEVLFVHKYSGSMGVESTAIISLSYTSATATMIYAQHLTRGRPEPSLNLLFPGIVIFLIGIAGNFHHHYILSNLRGKGEKEYKIPRGGLFNLVICPHYLFEIIVFLGISFISQTIHAFAFTLGTIVYLTGRSYATRKWYVSKFEDFPKDVKVLIPYIF